MPKIELRKTRDFSAKINATFEFIRENLMPLGKCLLYIGGPFFLLQGVFAGIYARESLSLGAAGTEIFGVFGELALWLGLMFISGGLGYVASIIVVFEYLNLYENKPEEKVITVSEVWEKFQASFFSVLVAGIVVTVAVVIGVLFLIIPGIYLSIPLTLLIPIILVERKSLGEAFSRCFSLITDKWWSTFGLLFVVGLIVGFMGFIFSIPQAVFTFLGIFHQASENFSTELPLWQEVGIMLTSIFQTVGVSLLRGIVLIALAFQYYNLVERRDAKGIMDKLNQFGQAVDTTPRANETY